MTIILTLHIALMVGSLTLTALMTGLSIFGKKVSALYRRLTLIATITGVGLGVTLLIAHPLPTTCAALFSYTLIFALAYRYVTRRQRALAYAD